MTSVRYPTKSAPAIGYLKRSANDIEVFVEDSSSPNMWVRLLQKYLPEGIKLNSVNILGDRKRVIEACKKDQSNDGRRKLYVIDADFDLISSQAKPNLKHLYRLQAYCVENYILNQEALTFVATSFNDTLSETDAAAKVNMEDWLKKNSDCLSRLFCCYAVCQKLGLGEKTVGYSCFLLRDMSAEEFVYCSRKVNARVFSLYRKLILRFGSNNTRSLAACYSRSLNKHGVQRCVSAKDYILPAIEQKLKSTCGVNVSRKQLKTLLADRANQSFDPYLSRRLKRICV